MAAARQLGQPGLMTQDMPSTPSAPSYKKLYRSRSQRMLAGVCGGVAEYFGIDPTLVRLAAVALCFAGGAGAVAYVVAWIVVPESPAQ
jgi:phage shock protein C